MGLIDNTKDVMDEIRLASPNSYENSPTTSDGRRQQEIIKYKNITFNTTAILHHYPQMKSPVKKSDHKLPIDVIRVQNNNSNNEKVAKNDNFNNNNKKIDELDRIEILNEKFTEEKLV